jgi:molecular chaperone GrpE (heat shock protein)
MVRLARALGFFRRPAPVLAEVDDPGATDGAAELEAQVRKGVRAQARNGARLEEIERKLEAGFADLRAAVAETSGRSTGSQLPWEVLFDAADVLEELGVGAAPSFSQGIRSIVSRLERFIKAGGIVRQTGRGEKPDGALFRVVGTVTEKDLPDGVVARVVRAALTCDGELVREGQVLTNQLTSRGAP